MRLPNLITREDSWGHTHSFKDYRIFNNLPMAEARDFHRYSHSFDNLVKQTIPSDHAALQSSKTPEQTHAKLDVQTSCLLFHVAAAS